LQLFFELNYFPIFAMLTCYNEIKNNAPPILPNTLVGERVSLYRSGCFFTMKYFIYSLSSEETLNLIYVGLTTKPTERLYQHKSSLTSPENSERISWIRSLMNLSSLKLEIIDTANSKEHGLAMEEFYFWLFKSWGFKMLNTFYSPELESRKNKLIGKIVKNLHETDLNYKENRQNGILEWTRSDEFKEFNKSRVGRVRAASITKKIIETKTKNGTFRQTGADCHSSVKIIDINTQKKYPSKKEAWIDLYPNLRYGTFLHRLRTGKYPNLINDEAQSALVSRIIEILNETKSNQVPNGQ